LRPRHRACRADAGFDLEGGKGLARIAILFGGDGRNAC
jgi:hypothetical protein